MAVYFLYVIFWVVVDIQGLCVEWDRDGNLEVMVEVRVWGFFYFQFGVLIFFLLLVDGDLGGMRYVYRNIKKV